ncbi:DeoR/GlpR family DNA-binding transcription regulator [Chakrabartyella piscis]|uniref:DeoR/GlpR family DNA-binding transcription regulator n=1 Tax=Chakrabartyella piscis TaxID=2918914 RepID=UPI0029588668|nr:DeoR/GlpR family DNA-binding transcription regulator [Chakrabartyella piscis]
MSKRLDEIRNLLFIRKRVYVNELAELYNISVVSIRKYLCALEEEGTAERFYGGASLVEKDPEHDSSPAMMLDYPVHAQLAHRACKEIHDGDIIFLGSGRTCCILAKLLHQFKNLSVVTNNITALDDLLACGARIYLMGGEVTSVDGKTLFSSPENPQNFMDNIRVNKAFTSISGIDPSTGLTVNSIISTYIYRCIPTIAQSWYLMASSDKFDRLSMYTVAGFEQIDYLITNDYPEEYDELFEQHDIHVISTQEDEQEVESA